MTNEEKIQDLRSNLYDLKRFIELRGLQNEPKDNDGTGFTIADIIEDSLDHLASQRMETPVSQMRRELAEIEYTNATRETFLKGFKGFNAYTDKEIVEQHDFYTCE